METIKNDRVRKSGPKRFNNKIDEDIFSSIQKYKNDPGAISERISELDREWDIERVLELNMSIAFLTGIVLALTINIYWIALTIIVLLFFIQHAIQGWCPPLPLFRYKKVRTKSEIDFEKYALKALRGDFQMQNENSPTEVFSAMKRN